MELIEHTTNWVKGEILESVIMGSVGALILIASILFWKFGNTPYARAMVVPLLVVGLIPFVMGIAGGYSNYQNISAYESQWKENPEAFVQAEKARVEGFADIFRVTYPMALILTIGGAILFFLIESPNWKAISLAMMLMGLMAYFIDHFARERGDMYYEYIVEQESRDNA